MRTLKSDVYVIISVTETHEKSPSTSEDIEKILATRIQNAKAVVSKMIAQTNEETRAAGEKKLVVAWSGMGRGSSITMTEDQ